MSNKEEDEQDNKSSDIETNISPEIILSETFID